MGIDKPECNAGKPESPDSSHLSGCPVELHAQSGELRNPNSDPKELEAMLIATGVIPEVTISADGQGGEILQIKNYGFPGKPRESKADYRPDGQGGMTIDSSGTEKYEQYKAHIYQNGSMERNFADGRQVLLSSKDNDGTMHVHASGSKGTSDYDAIVRSDGEITVAYTDGSTWTARKGDTPIWTNDSDMPNAETASGKPRDEIAIMKPEQDRKFKAMDTFLEIQSLQVDMNVAARVAKDIKPVDQAAPDNYRI